MTVASKQVLKPITLRSYRMLVRTIDALRNWAITDEGKAKLKALQEKHAAYSVPCPGEAHSNAYIDNCMMCAPQWGVMPNPKLVKRE